MGGTYTLIDVSMYVCMTVPQQIFFHTCSSIFLCLQLLLLFFRGYTQIQAYYSLVFQITQTTAHCVLQRHSLKNISTQICKRVRSKKEEKKQNTEVEVTSLEVFDSSKSVDIFNLLSKHLYTQCRYSIGEEKKQKIIYVRSIYHFFLFLIFSTT